MSRAGLSILLNVDRKSIIRAEWCKQILKDENLTRAQIENSLESYNADEISVSVLNSAIKLKNF